MKMPAVFLSSRLIEARFLIVLAVIVASLWLFVELADEVTDGEVNDFDRFILLALRNPADLSDPIGPGWVEEFGRDMTALGGVGVLTLLTLAIAGLLFLLKKRQAMLVVLLSTGSGILLSTVLKLAFDRPRPDLVPHGAMVYTASFPSGHSMMAAVTYLTLAALLASLWKERRLKIYLITVACLLTVAVGASRVYLGVHWPTDVIAGWLIGAAWALLWWTIAKILQDRGRMEQSSEGAGDP